MKKERVSLERTDPAPLADIVPLMIKYFGLSAGLASQSVLDLWDKVSGAGAYTLSKYVRGGVLYCNISSSIVRNRLYFRRAEMLEAINKSMQDDLVLPKEVKEKYKLKSIVLR